MTSHETIARGSARIALTNARTIAGWVVIFATVVYLVSIAAQAPQEFIQVFSNGVIDGSVYGLVAIGFGLMYSTVRFFDISYAITPVLSGFTVFYFNQNASRFVSTFVVGGLGSAAIVATVIALVLSLTLGICAYPALRARIGVRRAKWGIGAISVLLGVYGAILFLHPDRVNALLSPAIGIGVAVATAALGGVFARRINSHQIVPTGVYALLAAIGLAVGTLCGVTLYYRSSGANLYLGWMLGIALSGLTGMLFYGGLFRYLARKGRSLLVPMVGSMGVYLAMVALLSIVFTPNVKSLPVPFGSDSIAIAGAYVKPFSLFFVALVAALFGAFVLVLKKTTLGKKIRAIADDTELAMTVGINVSAVIMIVFFIGAACGAMAGIFVAEDTAFKPTTGLELLFQGWVASVVGGLGNVYGALLGGLLLGLLENYAIWYVDSEWKNSIAFGLLIVFVMLWPKGLLPRR